MNFALLLPQLPDILASHDSFDAMPAARPRAAHRLIAFWRRLKSGGR
ncbi:hypothetical protein KZJ38_17780 [Paraburkholderia edwinii]|jgi:hypothetical protein|uniref:Uncharacterized protein n=1 Tax=Paraburkholderia edwinii TaxID=2861782 RepID=A0ABX8UGQ7_9BURK|nr:hypothetical protein [Paraburkholderia edwinii]QYD68113.1 hypothetical protein KZJ38_17780 [Paraburkholderia edwinii]